ncbi:hypothetical protein HELRODRAFT_172429 [Helobdella robusta]|uniref:Uncharacterized protein n=1 Tax=Helobdella robusta TaxID=6412 RepID=T1F5B5_HELRO|nr:hypothetical protein HELRODRAFT_172429 [Helobdella robusta]ESO04757.1 hypothetical protein HELRODRAFT_172429 [Helobdella robusta]
MHVGSTPAYISHHITSANDNNNFTNINNINKNIILNNNNNNIDNNINIRSHSNGSSNYKIASIATSTSTAASANNCKQSIYTLDALPGQRIRISITDFTRWIPTDRPSPFNDEYDVAFNDGGDDEKLIDDHDDDDDDNRVVRNKLCEHDIINNNITNINTTTTNNNYINNNSINKNTNNNINNNSINNNSINNNTNNNNHYINNSINNNNHLKAGSTIYGYIIDSKTKDNKTICRTKNDMTMTSSGSSVELLLMNYHHDERYDGSFKILIQYRAIGCPDLTPPSTAWFRRVNDTCEVGCYDTDQSWHLICINDQWQGVLGNCSTNKGGMRFQRMSDQNFSNGIMILLVIGCSLVIALVIILVGVAYVKSIRSLTEMDYKQWKKEQQLLQQQQQQQQQQHTFPQQYQQHLMMTNVDKEAYLLSDPFVANKFQQQQQQHLYPPMGKPLPNDKIDNSDLFENSGGVFYDATTQQQPQQQLQQKFINTHNSNNNPQQNDFNCIIVDHLNEYSQILDPPADLTRKSNFSNNINNNITINNNISNKNVAPPLPPPLPTTLPASLANDPSSQNSSNPSSANNKIKDDNRFNKLLLT